MPTLVVATKISPTKPSRKAAGDLLLEQIGTTPPATQQLDFIIELPSGESEGALVTLPDHGEI